MSRRSFVGLGGFAKGAFQFCLVLVNKSEMKEFKATVKKVTPLVDGDMGEALGELKYISVTFAIEGAQEDLGPVVRAQFKEPESSRVVTGCNAPTTRRLRVISFAMEYLRLPC